VVEVRRLPGYTAAADDVAAVRSSYQVKPARAGERGEREGT
jgi:hypothetical protein